ncbi:TetR/AcrR family transcriptional regulator [Nonomuraea sp. NPDC050556]|uniref:TetR/AcrR family transcriptional regulator n=1 Tax=Nonomuraea sp. NPDC050556 TaxID=3364369 RepID=UPI0037923E3D
MAVAFTPAEKDRITGALLDAAERLFATQGLKKTALEELTTPAGIAKGSFYAFFDSKESLYKEVMLRRAPLIADRMSGALKARPSVEALTELMRTVAEILTTDPFYRRLHTHPEEMAAVTRRVGAHEAGRVPSELVDYFRDGQRDGLIAKDFAPEMLVAALGAVSLVVMTAERYGEAYEQVLEATIGTLARGMVA